MIALPWSVVTQLKLRPVGPINPEVFGLRYVGERFLADRGDGVWQTAPHYTIVDLPRARQTRDIWGTLQYDPRVIQRPYKPEKHPFYIAFCNLHQEVSR